jgi:hypothetical protein
MNQQKSNNYRSYASDFFKMKVRGLQEEAGYWGIWASVLRTSGIGGGPEK